jgi:hypothetical protein
MIKIVDDFIFITRSEGLGYVKYICEYNKDIFELVSEKYIPSLLEGDASQVTYKFKLLQKNELNSYINFIEDYGDTKNIISYIYKNNKLELQK